MGNKYISDRVGNDYKSWREDKIFIFAQTGRGKSKFVLEKVVPYCLERGEKVLILVNRKSLFGQYKYDVALKQEHYTPDVEIKTYQEYVYEIKRNKSWINAFSRYDKVVLDEIHFLISDADFNPHDTFYIYQAILHSFGTGMIFMSATSEELLPFFAEYAERIKRHVERIGCNRGNIDNIKEYSLEADYGYVQPEIVPDMESLISEVAKSQKKSIIFLDDIEQGQQIKNQIKSLNCKKQVVCLDANSMDGLKQEERKVMKALYMANRLDCDVLISTSVLDNGISIHDADVEIISIFTTSKSSFLQMLGRVRTEDTKGLRLLLVPHVPEYWGRREKILEEEMEEIKRLTEDGNFEQSGNFLGDALLNNSNKTELYKRIFVSVPDNGNFPVYNGVEKIVEGYRGGKRYAINRLSVAKMEQMLQTVRRMHVLSWRGIEKPCYEQLSWIGKTSDDVICKGSTYLYEEKERFLQSLLEVQNFSKEEFTLWKKEKADEYRDSILKHLKIRAGSPIKEDDLKDFLQEEGFALIMDKDENRRSRYSIIKVENEEA